MSILDANIKDKSKIKVCIGLSGGVDSSVAALLLKEAGYDVFALFMQNWHDASTTLHGDCEWEEDRFIAELVARKIGIPFYFVDLSKEYRKRVVDYMFDEYEKGRTPNPDVLCNREIKFDAFLKVAKSLGAELVATGHYCKKSSFVNEKGEVIYQIFAGDDDNKDQSYFLCQLNQEQLSQALFPIGNIHKPEVRRLATEAGLPSADKKDSQGICFVGKVDLPTFLQQKLEPREGEVVEVFDAYYIDNEHYKEVQLLLESLLRDDSISKKSSSKDFQSACSNLEGFDSESFLLEKSSLFNCFSDLDFVQSPYSMKKIANLTDEELLKLSEPIKYDINFQIETYRSGKKRIKKTRYKPHPYGKVVGKHNGAHFYTIGQRKGLNIGGYQKPIFVIETDIEKNLIYVGEGDEHKGLYRSCIRIELENIHWIREDFRMKVGEIRRYDVRVRYRQPLQDATLIMRKNGLYILFDEPQRGIAPGQFAVWYQDSEMLGSGAI